MCFNDTLHNLSSLEAPCELNNVCIAIVFVHFIFVVVDSLFNIAPIVCVGCVFGLCFCYTLLSFTIILVIKRGMIVFLLLSSWCLVDEHCRSLTLPHGDMGWSAVCDCGFPIILTYLLYHNLFTDFSTMLIVKSSCQNDQDICSLLPMYAIYSFIF